MLCTGAVSNLGSERAVRSGLKHCKDANDIDLKEFITLHRSPSFILVFATYSLLTVLVVLAIAALNTNISGDDSGLISLRAHRCQRRLAGGSPWGCEE